MPTQDGGTGPRQSKARKPSGWAAKVTKQQNSFITRLFYDALQRHPNQHPVKIGHPHKSNEMRVTNGAVCYLAYTHPVYGDIHLIFTAYAGGYGRRQSSISYELSMHRLLAVITLGETPQVWNKNARVFSHRQEIETQDIEAEIQRFQKDPWRVVTTKLKIPQELMEALQPPDDLVEARIEFERRTHHLRERDNHLRVQGAPALPGHRGAQDHPGQHEAAHRAG